MNDNNKRDAETQILLTLISKIDNFSDKMERNSESYLEKLNGLSDKINGLEKETLKITIESKSIDDLNKSSRNIQERLSKLEDKMLVWVTGAKVSYGLMLLIIGALTWFYSNIYHKLK